ncbi:pseudouridine synthase [Xanthovirga aplysinae]|uniref:pseudouridine synthase n=1 Tax=Xanthovirga aplysinae TaxID=2529853 RepID=UPI0012BB9A2A|nr:pseudouridine synthase [Xanthovirga aplysinae]MTI32386.1 rRNA pseudouridine synthase [Xanthovirga aplysinae]
MRKKNFRGNPQAERSTPSRKNKSEDRYLKGELDKRPSKKRNNRPSFEEKEIDRTSEGFGLKERKSSGYEGGKKSFRRKPERFKDHGKPSSAKRGAKYGKERVREKQDKRLEGLSSTKRARTPDYNFDKIKEISQKTQAPKNQTEIRLNRYIANCGVCSRRDADLLIQNGEIKVNGKVVTELGFKVKSRDEVRYRNKPIRREKLIYVLLNKPKDFITTTNDPEERKTVMQLVKNACEERIYPVGRLDRNTTGLLLFTNDGDLAEKLAHPSHKIKKVYQVELDKPISKEHYEQITKGLELEDGKVEVDELALLSPDNKTLGVEIHLGRNRIVRRIFEFLGYEVVKLDRVLYAGLSKKNLPRGKWRFLTEKEMIQLKFFTK